MYVKGIAGEDKFIVRSVMTCGQQKAPDFQGPFVFYKDLMIKFKYHIHDKPKNHIHNVYELFHRIGPLF